MHWAWSCSSSTLRGEARQAVSGLNRTIVFMQPHSVGSGGRSLNLLMISRTVLTSVSRPAEREAALAVRRWEMSQATDHWQRCSRNKSFQHSCSSNICRERESKIEVESESD